MKSPWNGSACKVVTHSDTHTHFTTNGALEGQSDITFLDRPVREEEGLQL